MTARNKYRDHKWFKDPHEWESVDMKRITRVEKADSEVGMSHVLICTICGELKVFTVMTI